MSHEETAADDPGESAAPASGPAPDAPRSIALRGQDAGARLDRFLADVLALSRARVRGLLADGRVSLSGRALGYGDKGLPLPAEGTLEIEPFTRPGDQQARPAPAVRVLAEGPGWVAVDKPAGMPVHPLREDEGETVLGALVASHPRIQGIGEGGLRSGVLHRLDVETSGVLLFATEPAHWERLRGAFREHRVEKHYRALVMGRVPDALLGRTLSFELAVARHRPARVRVVDASWSKPGRAYPARQGLEVLERFVHPVPGSADEQEATLLDVRIETGFLHQIRVTLAHLGHPVLGDALYGDPASLAFASALGVERQMLHAARIRFEEVAAESPDPQDLRAVLDRLRAGRETRQENES